MSVLINPRIMLDPNGEPEFVVIPIAEYRELMRVADRSPGVPNSVVRLVFDSGFSPVRAWREYKGLTQEQVAERMGIRQPTYAEHEQSGKKLRRSTLEKIAKALEIVPEQLDF